MNIYSYQKKTQHYSLPRDARNNRFSLTYCSHNAVEAPVIASNPIRRISYRLIRETPREGK